MRIAFSGYLPAPCYKLVDERLQIRSEERRQYRHSFVDVLWHIVELHVIRAFYDMELLIGTCGALTQIVADPFASRHTPGHEPVSEHRTDINGTYPSDRFDATVVDGCIGCITSAAQMITADMVMFCPFLL